ncbi:hypothetical protein [Mammaliicoccus sciuri]|uniref:hypothetical protein n=1 Tax=Mammaliicoccus sciuri TaxID=1296 RepID=UPI0034DCE95B
MPTIKTKKEMNLPELIEWATENDVRNKSFCGDRYCDEVSFDENKDMTCEYITINEIFTVEIEEEITEDTVLPELVTRTVKGHYGLWKKGSINSFKHITFNDVEAFYVPNDDLTMTLIWRDGELVE